jgi:predicted trehalose synthase
VTRGGPLHSRFRELQEYLTEARQGLLATVSGLTAVQLQRRPSEEVWSPGETLEHLRLTESSIVKILRKLLRETDLSGLGPEVETSSIMSALDAFRLVQVVRRVSAPAFVQPDPHADGHAALVGLAQSRAQLIEVITRADGWAVGSLSFPHPLIGPLDFYQWVLFVGQHEVRHTCLIQKALSIP